MIIIKETPGFVRQKFDDNGVLISQEFIADNNGIEYSIADSLEQLHEDDHRRDFYAPFDMVQPTVKEKRSWFQRLFGAFTPKEEIWTPQDYIRNAG